MLRSLMFTVHKEKGGVGKSTHIREIECCPVLIVFV